MVGVVSALEIKKAIGTRKGVSFEISSVPSKKNEDTENSEWCVKRSAADVKALHAQILKVCENSNIDLPYLEPHNSSFLISFSVFIVPIAAAVGGIFANPEKIPFINEANDSELLVAAGAALLCWIVLFWSFVHSFIKLSFANYDKTKVELCDFLNTVNRASVGNEKISNFLEAFLEPPLRKDWPARVGPINLDVQDLPHDGSQTEWWYYNAHLESSDKRPLSLFVCFFRFLKHVDKRSGKKYYNHALTWAITDVKNEKYYSDVLLESDTPEILLKALDEGKIMKDPILKRALREVCEKGNVPLPDRLFEKKPKVSNSSLNIEYETSSVVKDSQGNYILKARHYMLPCSLDLTFVPRKNAIRHGNNGVVKGVNGDDMFYYCIPRCDVSGVVSIPKPHKAGGKVNMDADTFEVTGNGWYDHEFGGKEIVGNVVTQPEQKVRYAWNWVAAQLEDNTEVTAAVLINPDTNSVMEVKAIVVDSEGNRTQFDESDGVVFESTNLLKREKAPSTPVASRPVEPEHDPSPTKLETKVATAFEHEEVKDGEKFEIPTVQTKLAEVEDDSWWRSVRTFKNYPTGYHLTIPSINLDLNVSVSFADQEFMTIIAKPAFWEGRCDVSGTKAGKDIKGLAYVERNGFGAETTIKTFFSGVGKTVRSSVQKMYPLEPTFEEGVELIATEETKHYMKGVPLKELGQTLIKPVREIADRGGKSWRSYGALACVDCVGGDSRDFIEWIAMPEFLHVGSLIVDDIQDKSETRRGGTCSHLLYGEPLCINAGTAAYFQCEQLIKAPGLSAEDLNKCYGLYFAALRGGHAGQALDIHGLDYMMEDVVETGEASLLEERSLAIHMLKTAVPAGTLARMGALVGKGSEKQIEQMGLYFEGIGVAFQIMDDVLNLRGLYANSTDKMKKGTVLKTLGEDIVEGKVTMPVVKAMGKIKTREERQRLWDIISSKPQDQAIVDSVIAQLEELGAIQECVDQAKSIVNEAWAELDQVIPDSFAKMMLRSFGWFVIER